MPRLRLGMAFAPDLLHVRASKSPDPQGQAEHIVAEPFLTSATPLACQLPPSALTPSRTRFQKAVLATLSVFLLLSLITHTLVPCGAFAFDPSVLSLHSLKTYARATAAKLQDFQVYPPVLTVNPKGGLEITDGSSNASVAVIPSNQPTCQQTLVLHSFANSYGQPYVGPFHPPSCSFNRVSWNLTVVAAGRQYDRLGSVSFGDIELFRTSTAEPTANGIEWTYIKDMTNFLSLFRKPNTVIFDLGNLVNSIYTAPFNVTLTASYFTAEDSIIPADTILPVSSRQGSVGKPSYFTVPPDTASNSLTLPRNVKKAVFTVAATGQSQEEFWWSNVLQSEINTFPSYGSLYGYSPFREVQLFIDGALAGVAWPYPIIFTGGVVPGLWRPIVGIDAFDLKEDEIDITPWLPLLCDGKAHNFTIGVSGLNDHGNGTATLSGTTDSYWWVSGKVFIWLDQAGHVTTGSGPYKTIPAPKFQVSSAVYQDKAGDNDTLLYKVEAQRSLSIASTLNLSTGKTPVFWSQSLTYSNVGNFSQQGFYETNTQHTGGYDVSSSGYARQYSYPLYAYTVETIVGPTLTLFANVQRSKDVNIVGQPVFPTGLESFAAANSFHSQYRSLEGAALSTTQNGTATFVENTNTLAAYGFGTTEQNITFSGFSVGGKPSPGGFPSISGTRELFTRHVLAVNSTVVDDQETLINTPIGHQHGGPGSSSQVALSGVPGRGGRLRAQLGNKRRMA